MKPTGASPAPPGAGRRGAARGMGPGVKGGWGDTEPYQGGQTFQKQNKQTKTKKKQKKNKKREKHNK